MVKIIIEITEENTIELSKTVAVGTNINITEKGINATKYEKKVANLIKDNLHVDKKLQIYNESSKTKEDLKEELLKLLRGI